MPDDASQDYSGCLGFILRSQWSHQRYVTGVFQQLQKGALRRSWSDGNLRTGRRVSQLRHSPEKNLHGRQIVKRRELSSIGESLQPIFLTSCSSSQFYLKPSRSRSRKFEPRAAAMDADPNSRRKSRSFNRKQAKENRSTDNKGIYA